MSKELLVLVAKAVAHAAVPSVLSWDGCTWEHVPRYKWVKVRLPPCGFNV